MLLQPARLLRPVLLLLRIQFACASCAPAPNHASRVQQK
jgi:hypothetical protein